MNKPQVFCFTYAGGTGNFFRTIADDLPELELSAPDYPGHGKRHREPLLSDFDTLADDMFRTVQEQWNGGRYALFGYSMGTITVTEVLRRILSCGMPLPECVFLAAHAPDISPEFAAFQGGEIPDELVRARTVAFGTVPETLLGNRSFWRMYLPLYRTDYTLISRYSFREPGLEAPVRAVIFYSESDTPLRTMEKWRSIFTGGCSFAAFTGNHFFIKEHHKEMADMIRGILLPESEVRQ